MNLETTYLGLRLAHPFMVGSSPFSSDLDTIRRLEDAGSAAIVLPSLFEEQITMAERGRIHHIDPLDGELGGAVRSFPTAAQYLLGPEEYLEHVRRVTAAVAVPVIASLNGMTAEPWLKFALRIEEAGADALELNMYEVVADPDEAPASIETKIRSVVLELKRQLHIPIAVKLSPFFTAFGHFARDLDRAGADGLVLFNRFYQPDIDIERMTATPRIALSTSAELLLRLRWIAMLRSRVHASLALTGGVATPSDGIKALLVGADAVQLVSAILRHGVAYIGVMAKGVQQWMEGKHFTSLHDVRGRLCLRSSADSTLGERAAYIRTLLTQKLPA